MKMKRELQDMTLHLEMSKRCLLQCPKCPRTKNTGHYKIDDLPIEHMKTIVNATNPRRVTFCGNYGDPLYHPKILDAVRFLHDSDIPFEFHTNGSGKKVSWWEEFYNCYENKPYGRKEIKSTVWFGLDGLEDTAHLYRVNTNWREVFDAMCLGVKMNQEIIWQWIPFSFNEHQIEEAKKLAEDNGIHLLLRLSDRWDSREGKFDPLEPTEKFKPTTHHTGNGYIHEKK